MQQRLHEFEFETRGPGAIDITREIEALVHEQGLDEGLLQLQLPHSFASLLVQENADPAVLRDLEAFLGKLAPWGDPSYEHSAEGPDDMPAHIRSSLLPVTLSLPVSRGGLCLGTWQGIYLYEHRARGHRRQIVAHLLGER